MIRHNISWDIIKWIIWQFVRNKTLILGRKHQFLTFFRWFLEIFYTVLVTYYSTVNELWFDITLADTSKKWIIWQIVYNKTFILGRKHQFLTFFHRFLEIFYNFLHHSIQLWVSNGLRYMLSDLSRKGIIWPFVRYKTFIFGDKTSIFDIFHRFLEVFIISYTILFNGELVMTWDRYYLINQN